MHAVDHHHCSDQQKPAISLQLNDLKVVSALGRGAKGVVFHVQTEIGESLALKTILKSSIEKKKLKNNSIGDEYKRICFERKVLASLDHPLLPKLHGVVVTDKIVGYAIDYCPGGDLHNLRKKQTEKMFSNDIIRFYAAELVLALEYLHKLGIVYRDLKPENVMIQENGHLMLVDFDLSTKLTAKSPETRSIAESKIQIKTKNKKNKFARFFKRRRSGISPENTDQTSEVGSESANLKRNSMKKSNSFVGTEEYISPEIILGKGHDFAVDWWCLGIMLYEMLYGTTPFRGATEKDTFYKIITKSPNLTGELTPLRDLIRKLLEKDPQKRFSVSEIKSHAFFQAVDWESLTDMPRPPFIPEKTEVEDMEGNKVIDVETYVQQIFQGGEGNVNMNKMENKKNYEGNNEKNLDVWVSHPTKILDDNFLVF